MEHFIAMYGYAAIFLLMVAESACIPIPSELIMTFAGALAAGAVAGGHLNLVAVIAAVWIFARRRRGEMGSGDSSNGARYARPGADRTR
jgi:uncharacterized membrane protein YdjX (TVP38/TMEM64 family)